MKVSYILNNYQMGRSIKTSPTEKILSQNRLDKSHTEVIYNLEHSNQKEFCDKLFGKNGKIMEQANNLLHTTTTQGEDFE